MITASRLELVRSCPASVTLPWVDEKTPEAEAGTKLHKEWEDRINAGDIPDELESRWPGYAWRAEVPFAWSLADGTGRELPNAGGHRDYSSVGPLEIAGTCDIVGRLGGKLVVADKKSFMKITPAVRNAQLHIAALALSRAYDVDDVEVGIFHEVNRPDVETLDGYAIDAFAREARLIMASAKKAQAAPDSVEFRTGTHCRYCPAFHACPAQAELSALVAGPELANRIELSIPLADDTTALDMFRLYERLGMLQKRLRSVVYARAAERPIPLGDGTAFGAVATEGSRKLDGDRVWSVMTELHGANVADAAVKRTATQKGLEMAIRAVAPKGAAAAMQRTAMKAIETAGGVTRKPSVKFKAAPMGTQFALGVVDDEEDSNEA